MHSRIWAEFKQGEQVLVYAGIVCLSQSACVDNTLATFTCNILRPETRH